MEKLSIKAKLKIKVRFQDTVESDYGTSTR